MKILLGWFGHETNTFSRRTSDYDLLISQGYWEGNDILETFRNTPSYMGGMIRSAEENDVTLIPTIAVENAGPTLSDDCLYQVVDKLCEYIHMHKNDIDGICLGLHGAGVSESHEDIESYTLRSIREIVGNDMPIMITLDLHGNISHEMAELSTAMFGIKENPHVDYASTGYEAMDTLVRTVRGDIAPYTHVEPIPLIMPMTPTINGAYKELTDFLRVYKQENNLLDVSFFPGFPFADIKDSRACVFITAEKNAREHGEILARHIWELRHELVHLDTTGSEEALTKALQVLNSTEDGYVVINEASDNPGCGAPGDSTLLLTAIIAANIRDSAFAYIYDPESVDRAIKAGIGSKVDLMLGGKIEDSCYHGEPISIKDAIVKTISDGAHISTTPLMSGIPGSFGKTVTIGVGNVDIVIASVQNQTYDDRAFFVGGIDINQKRLLGLKSAQHFKAFYGDKARAIIPANPRGIATSNLTLLDYKNIARPVYPLDKETQYK